MNKISQDSDFNFWVPVDFEKAETKKGEKVMKIKGIASTADKDSDGEILEPVGFDLSRFLSDGYLNWNHQAKNNASAIIGEPTLAKVNPKGELYVEGVLYNGHPLAESVWQLAETLQNNNSKRRIGFSIEGRATERDPINPKRITKAMLTGLAVTTAPVNCSTYMEIVKGEQKSDFQEYDKENILNESVNAEYLYEFNIGERHFGITKSFGLAELEKGESERKKAKIKKVMDEFKAGTLKSSSGEVVTDRKQAIAIAMSEAGITQEKSMDVAATQPLVPQSLDKKPKVLEPVIRKALLGGYISVRQFTKQVL